MTTHVSAREYVLNGTLVQTSTPITRDERTRLGQLSFSISQSLKRHGDIFDATVTNGTITVLPAPHVTADEDVDQAVRYAIDHSRIGGSKLCGADTTVDGPFKHIRSCILEYAGQKESELLRATLVQTVHLLKRGTVSYPKRKRSRFIAADAARAASMIETILLGRSMD